MGKCSDPSTCSRVMRVLANETRLRIVRELLGASVRVGDLAERLGLGPARVSHHLGILRAAGVVEDERRGKSVYYRLDPSLRAARRREALDLGCCLLMFRPLDAEPTGSRRSASGAARRVR